MPILTAPPADGIPVALYDGHCRFCTAWARRLHRAARGRIAIVSFHDPGVLARFPGVSHDECMRELKLVDERGRVHGGAAAVVRAVNLGHPLLAWPLLLYYLPGIRQLADRAYAAIAGRRYRLFGRATEVCDDGSCGVHLR